MTRRNLTRRTFLVLSASAGGTLAGCTTALQPRPSSLALAAPPVRVSAAPPPAPAAAAPTVQRTPELDAWFAAREDGGHTIPAVPYWRMDPKFFRQRVVDPTGEPAGTVVVDTPNRFLYLVEPGGMALRYGVGIGRDGFAWGGEGVIHWRQPWPRWKVPAEMVARKPSLEIYSVANGGMAPGVDNPLGARALYIFQNGQDTLYRLHGTPEWDSIGGANSSGCVRLVNQDVIDLYDRVPHHARIVVHQAPLMAAVGAAA
ncbi:L,D-transpeptidase [Aurantimonas sp. Leaf443]|uniref:L,D-transpeptidase n=1 Tax=Aurantimonas sp. Leaf443 TaxID=1736378 RepID=UPI000700D54B|nr:L,D-transpeptidase [Aurantimonas sp. Leaf443]KQT85576.1 hypothetical protein ASG48_10230 [Aurantimonas sp. Leaf443]